VVAPNVSAVAEAPAKPAWLGWVRAARAGDRAAFTALHRHFAGLVHAVIIARVPATEAGDLTQDVFVQLMQGLSGLRDEVAFPAWLMQLARNRAGRWVSSHPRWEPLPEEPQLAAPDRSGWPDARRVLVAIQRLPEAYAETMAMRFIEGLSGPEIAARTGLSPGSVRVNLHRGLAKLRAELGLPPGDEVSDG
jgi:RNA polymerase sigma-70 factor (ECF subfamily)